METNNPLIGDGNLPPAKKRRGRPPGSKNKVKVDATLNGPEHPKPPGKPMASRRKAKSSPQSVPAVQVDFNRQEGSIPADQDLVLDPALFQNAPVEGVQFNNSLQQDLSTPHHPQAISAEEAVPNIIDYTSPVPTINIFGLLQLPTTAHRPGCPCHACFRDRPYEYKTTNTGASFQTFANLVGETAAAFYQRTEEIGYMMGAYAKLPAATWKYQQQKLVRDSFETQPMYDHQGNPITTAPMPAVVKENVTRMATLSREDLIRRNRSFRFFSPGILEYQYVEDTIISDDEGMELELGEDMDEDAD